MKRIKLYLQEAYNELVLKVSWPSKKDLTSSALIVMVSSLICALLVFVMDICFKNLVTFIYKLFV